MISDEVLALMQPGAVLWFWSGTKTPNPTRHTIHVRAIVDETVVVYRIWRRFQWQYHMKDIYFFQLLYEHDALKPAK